MGSVSADIKKEIEERRKARPKYTATVTLTLKVDDVESKYDDVEAAVAGVTATLGKLGKVDVSKIKVSRTKAPPKKR